MSVTIAVALVALNRPMGALARPVGIRIEDEAAHEDRLDHGAKGVMDDAVAEWRRGNNSGLRLEHLNLDIAPRPPSARQQFPFEPQHLGFQPGHEGGGAQFAALAADGAASGPHQRAKLGDSPEQVRMARGHDLP